MRQALWGERPTGMRRFAALVAGIPLDSALGRQLDPDRMGKGWGYQEELLATVAELLDHGNRQNFAFNTKRGTRVPQAIYIPRPYTKTRPSADPEALKAALRKRGIPVFRRKKKES